MARLQLLTSKLRDDVSESVETLRLLFAVLPLHSDFTILWGRGG